jgi:hypothetical protein
MSKASASGRDPEAVHRPSADKDLIDPKPYLFFMSETTGPRADELDEQLAEQSLIGQWEFIRQVENNPPPSLQPHVWEWDNIYQSLQRATAEINVDELTPDMRRAVLLVNPGLQPLPSPSPTRHRWNQNSLRALLLPLLWLRRTPEESSADSRHRWSSNYCPCGLLALSFCPSC